MSRQRLIIGLILIFGGILFLISIWRFGSILGFFLVYPWVISHVLGYGLNPHLSNIIALVITFFLVVFIWRLFILKPKAGLACLVGLLILQSSYFFLAERERYVSVKGKILKYYTVHPVTGKYLLFDQPVYDQFGQKAQPITPEIAIEIERQKVLGKKANLVYDCGFETEFDIYKGIDILKGGHFTFKETNGVSVLLNKCVLKYGGKILESTITPINIPAYSDADYYLPLWQRRISVYERVEITLLGTDENGHQISVVAANFP
jgi:hypothetical protein